MARRKASADSGRSAGRFLSAQATRSSRSGWMPDSGATSSTRGAGVVMWWAITTTASSSPKGTVPVSIWKSITPTA